MYLIFKYSILNGELLDCEKTISINTNNVKIIGTKEEDVLSRFGYESKTAFYILYDGHYYGSETINQFDINNCCGLSAITIPFSYQPPALLNARSDNTDVAVTGAGLGDLVVCVNDLTAYQNVSVYPSVSGTDTVRILTVNETGLTVTLPILNFKIIKL